VTFKSDRVALALYSFALWLLTPAYLLRLWWRGRAEPLYRHAMAERLGFYASVPSKGVVWVHAVSLGETLAASALIDALRLQRPGMRLLLTHSTATGFAAGTKLLQAGDQQTWLPLDTPQAVRRFFDHFQPCVGVLMETEIWPNVLHIASARQLPMVLANARLSDKSLRKSQGFMKAVLAPAVRSLTRVLAQTEADAARLRSAGATDVVVCGNLKFDITPSAALLAQGATWRAVMHRPVLLAAVTREGEEAMLLSAWKTSAKALAVKPLLVIVPRHPQRFDEVAALVASQGLRLARRSTWQVTPTADALGADVWLGDSMGEMPLYYALAQVALLGGSFAPLGGQNLIEAAACGCPVVMGPHTFNFAQAAELSEAAGAAIRVAHMQAGVHAALALMASPQRTEVVSGALAFAAAHRGAAERMATHMARLIEPA
jgi:3-deoxy-D-manno-octulosonic-acid transferase